MSHQFLCQPRASRSHLDLLDDALSRDTFTKCDAAFAYASASGVDLLLDHLATNHAKAWGRITKRWLVGIDWYRSSPPALRALSAVSSSQVRIHDGSYVVERAGCTPRVTFHPKALVLSSPRSLAVISGSGNLSRNGLARGHEVSSLITAKPGPPAKQQKAYSESRSVLEWFESMWRNASPLSKLISKYEVRYDKENVPRPTVIDDDVISSLPRTRGLSTSQLAQLRAATHFWIEAGNITANRGPGRPGDQLMMSRHMRVYFGFPARDVPENSLIGHTKISYDGTLTNDRSIRFSDNSMDVLTLPVPGSGGPASYDKQTLCFKRVSRKTGIHFELQVETGSNAAAWKKASRAVHAEYKMTSGRRWGVF